VGVQEVRWGTVALIQQANNKVEKDQVGSACSMYRTNGNVYTILAGNSDKRDH
jgi:hypothetical protein